MIEQKKALRRAIRALKNAMSIAERAQQSSVILSKLEASKEFRSSDRIMLYWAMDDEVQTQDFINKWYATKKIYLPVINGDDLKIVLYEGESSLVAGDKYGIPEPNGKEIDDEASIQIVVVPGVAFDAKNNRMGRGAGYYDRILKRIPSAFKLALAFDYQMVKSVPVEPHDIAMDAVISF